MFRGQRKTRWMLAIVFLLALLNIFGSQSFNVMLKPVAKVFWGFVHQNAWLLDPQLNKCFREIPKVPEFWGPALACPLGAEPSDGLPDGTARFAVVQYEWALDARPFSPECSKYAKDLYRSNKTLTNAFRSKAVEVWAHEPHHPDPAIYKWGIPDLPKPEHPSTDAPRTSSDGTSVLMTLIDSIGRGTYSRLMAPSLVAAAGEDYTVFDFTRFHIVDSASKRNTVAVFGGRVREIFESLRTGALVSEGGQLPGDKRSCEVEANEMEKSKDPSQLSKMCSLILWRRFREQGYLTGDDSTPDSVLRAYFGLCDKACANMTIGRPFLSLTYHNLPTNVSLFKRAAGAFHYLTKPNQPVFFTEYSGIAHNAFMEVGSLAYEASTYVRTLRESAKRLDVKLPLVVLFADHGLHYGEAVERSRMGMMEHKFPMLVILVPNKLLVQNPSLRNNLELNRQRLVSAFDLHHTLAEFAGGPSNSHVQHDLKHDGSDGLITRRNFFRDVIPIDRNCSDAGIEPFFCQCEEWAAPPHGADEAVTQQGHIALQTLNRRIKAMLQTLEEQLKLSHGQSSSSLGGAALGADPRCVPHLMLHRVTSVEVINNAPLLKFILEVNALHKRARFQVLMHCHRSSSMLRRKSTYSFLQKPCNLSTVLRLTSMSKAESDIYKTLGAELTGNDGKLCVIPG
eukprot:TRINITY_DN8859_c1_g1_i1.p1 TRINITY_DN8859_c1_g1~~TRINITY_DN8859_c1_g1_i1.p1  ORF type:complete len:679 (-),score=41.51 TRINITY_DN8859_c1_g1_i1:135-2171(-)